MKSTLYILGPTRLEAQQNTHKQPTRNHAHNKPFTSTLLRFAFCRGAARCAIPTSYTRKGKSIDPYMLYYFFLFLLQTKLRLHACNCGDPFLRVTQTKCPPLLFFSETRVNLELNVEDIFESSAPQVREDVGLCPGFERIVDSSSQRLSSF